jgi:DNA-binding response OmpR family regulator
MSALGKNPVTQLLQVPMPGPTAALFVAESVARFSTIHLKEIGDFSHCVPVIVLIHKSAVRKLAVREMPNNNSVPETSKSTSLMELFGQAMESFNTAERDSAFVFGDVIVNFSSVEVCRKGQPVVLTALEFKALKYFIQNARRAISRDELLNHVWGYENYPYTRTVDNHILRLRQKLESDPSRPVHFRTVHGTGYKFLP